MKTCIPDLRYFPNFKDPHSVAVENMNSASSTLLAIYFYGLFASSWKVSGRTPKWPIKRIENEQQLVENYRNSLNPVIGLLRNSALYHGAYV